MGGRGLFPGVRSAYESRVWMTVKCVLRASRSCQPPQTCLFFLTRIATPVQPSWTDHSTTRYEIRDTRDSGASKRIILTSERSLLKNAYCVQGPRLVLCFVVFFDHCKLDRPLPHTEAPPHPTSLPPHPLQPTPPPHHRQKKMRLPFLSSPALSPTTTSSNPDAPTITVADVQARLAYLDLRIAYLRQNMHVCHIRRLVLDAQRGSLDDDLERDARRREVDDEVGVLGREMGARVRERGWILEFMDGAV